jgi:hypothetical protein
VLIVSVVVTVVIGFTETEVVMLGVVLNGLRLAGPGQERGK